MCHLDPLPRTRRPRGSSGVVASIHGVTLVSDSALPFASFFAKSLIARSVAMIEATPVTRRKDAVLSPWGSSGTGMCRGRELRQGRQRERRPAWRQDGGPVRRRRSWILPKRTGSISDAPAKYCALLIRPGTAAGHLATHRSGTREKAPTKKGPPMAAPPFPPPPALSSARAGSRRTAAASRGRRSTNRSGSARRCPPACRSRR